MFDLPGITFNGSQCDEKNVRTSSCYSSEGLVLRDVEFLLLTRVSSQSLACCIIFGLY